jgi:activating signal cointegrator complex subunit 3
MMGRAGRPQFDVQGKAVILVQDIKKEFYKKFVYEPFPVESSLPDQLHNHFCAEVVSGTIKSKQDAIDYLTWTYFFRRLVMNPAYYHLEDLSHDGINLFLSNLVDNTLADLEEAQCVLIDDMTGSLEPLTLGRIASYYYLDYSTVMMFANSIGDEMSIPQVLAILSDATEFDEVPVRHNEDKLNAELCEHVRMKDALEMASMELPSTKTQLLLQAHFDDIPLPISDYYTDVKMVLDQAIRVIQAMIDVSADSGWLATTLSCMTLVQMIVQAKWHDASTLTTLPKIDDDKLATFARHGIECLPELVHFLKSNGEDKGRRRIQELERQLSRKGMTKGECSRAFSAALSLPLINVNWSMETDVFGPDGEGKVNVVLSRVNMPSMKVMSPVRKYTGKSEGHWLALGCEEQGELLALKRVTVRRKTETTLNFYTDDLGVESGDVTLSLYLISDSYLGLDQ